MHGPLTQSDLICCEEATMAHPQITYLEITAIHKTDRSETVTKNRDHHCLCFISPPAQLFLFPPRAKTHSERANMGLLLPPSVWWIFYKNEKIMLRCIREGGMRWDEMSWETLGRSLRVQHLPDDCWEKRRWWKKAFPLLFNMCHLSRVNENNLNRVMGSVDGAGSNGVLDLINWGSLFHFSLSAFPELSFYTLSSPGIGFHAFICSPAHRAGLHPRHSPWGLQDRPIETMWDEASFSNEINVRPQWQNLQKM